MIKKVKVIIILAIVVIMIGVAGMTGPGKMEEKKLEEKKSVEIPALLIKRSGSDRINKSLADRYVMIITITAGADFSGEITDTLPPNVEVVWQGAARIMENKIFWKADLKKDVFKEFKYEYVVSDLTPFKIGPILVNDKIFENYAQIN